MRSRERLRGPVLCVRCEQRKAGVTTYAGLVQASEQARDACAKLLRPEFPRLTLLRGWVQAVCSSPRHDFSKQPQLSIRLLAGRGVEGDAHCGETVQHLYLKRRDSLAPNRMQVHLLQSELFDEMALTGFDLSAGQLGENITTRGIDLLRLPLGTRLRLGETAVVELTGLRTPCKQIDRFRAGLLKQVVGQRVDGAPPARAGAMAIVLQSGDVRPDAEIVAELPEEPHQSMRMI